MAVGYPINKQNLDAQVAQLVTDLRNTLTQCSRMKAWLDTLTTADLVAMGYVEQADPGTVKEVSRLKSAFTALDALNKVSTGQQAVPTADDFLFWGRTLIAYN